jgi:hypothetical protein
MMSAGTKGKDEETTHHVLQATPARCNAASTAGAGGGAAADAIAKAGAVMPSLAACKGEAAAASAGAAGET